MHDLTIPVNSQIVSGQYFAGWTWYSRTLNGEIYRFFYYIEAFSSDQYQLVYFTKEENYEQFKDDIEKWGQDRAKRQSELHDELLAGGVNNNRSRSNLQHISEEDKRALLERSAKSKTS